MRKQTLEQQLAETNKLQEQAENKAAELKKKSEELSKQINEKANANKPKSIMELINCFEDACKYKNVKPSSLFNNKTDTVDEIAYKKIKFTIKVLNEGHVFKRCEPRHFPYFYDDVSSGFGFDDAHCDSANAATISASRLCLKSEKLAIHAGKILLCEWEQFIW